MKKESKAKPSTLKELYRTNAALFNEILTLKEDIEILTEKYNNAIINIEKLEEIIDEYKRALKSYATGNCDDNGERARRALE